MDVFENGSYHKLLLMYKGETTADGLLASVKAGGLAAATIGYGGANWHLYNGRRADAARLFQEIVEKNAAQWAAFGYIAAEADLERNLKTRGVK
jgi:hypothetical protein